MFVYRFILIYQFKKKCCFCNLHTHIFDRVHCTLSLLVYINDDDLVVVETYRRNISDKRFFVIVCEIFWIKYCIKKPIAWNMDYIKFTFIIIIIIIIVKPPILVKFRTESDSKLTNLDFFFFFKF